MTTTTHGPTTGNAPRRAAAPGFGTTLQHLRKQEGLSQAELSRRARLDPSYLSRLEAGDRTPSRDAVRTIAHALRLTRNDRSDLYAAAGFLPDSLADVLRHEPALASALTVLEREDVPETAKEIVRQQIAGTVAMVEAMTRSVSALPRREIEGRGAA